MFSRIRKISVFIVAILTAMMLLGCGNKQNAVSPETKQEVTVQAAAETVSPAASVEDHETVAKTFSETVADDTTEEITYGIADDVAGVNTEAAAETDTAATTENKSRDSRIDESGYFYDVENVALYIHTYGRLPDNYITKNEAKALGWEGGSVEQVKPDAAIGGDHFGNYEGQLPEKSGRVYTECDIDTHGYKNRGSRRLIFSNDGLYFYTGDHYQSFRELYVTDEGIVKWK